jgi:hypothetical protein
MTKGKNFKKPRSKGTARFEVKTADQKTNYDLSKPIFSFKHIKYRGSYCISQCQEEKKSLIIDTLLRLSQSTWQEIKRLPKVAGFESIPRHRFIVPLPSILTPEVAILVVRYDGDGGRLAGYREKDIYHIVLVGRNLYPH